jgi:hypothetical protein
MKRLIVLGLALALAAGILFQAAAPVMADVPTPVTITFFSGNTTQTTGYTTSNPITNPLNPNLYGNGSGTWLTAPLVDDPFWWGAVIYGASWVSTSATENISEGDAWRLYKDEFNIPAGMTIGSANITLQIAADNAYEVYFNNSRIASTAPEATIYGPSPDNPRLGDGGTMDPFNVAATFTANITPHSGTNTLMFVVRNWDNGDSANPTSLLYAASITYEAAPAPPPTPTPTPTPPAPPATVGGTVFSVNKAQLLAPWLGALLGLLALSLAVNRFVLKRKT